MDSFYDMPRRAPTPTNIEKCLIAPVVPEVSMICTSKDSATDYNAYNIWKSHQQESNVLTSNRDNFKYSDRLHFPMNQQHFRGYQNSSQFLKKQVRFESPPLQQKPSLSYEPFMRKKEVQDQNISNSKKNCGDTMGIANAFEQIYMANVPSRQLDLSIIDLPSFPKQMEQVHAADQQPEKLEVSCHDCIDAGQKNVDFNEDKENEMPKTYRDFLEMQKNTSKERYSPNDSVTDIFNYKKNVCSKTSEGTELPKNSILSTKILPISDNRLYRVNNMTNQKPSRNPLDDSLQFMITKGDYNDLADNEVHGYEQQKQKNKVVCTQKDQHCLDQDTNILNQMCDSGSQTSNFCDPPKPTETSISKVDPKDDSEPSTRDLLKIISQQNEQLLLLQRQVAMLLNREQNKQIEGIPPKVDYTGEKYVTSTQNEHFRQDNLCTPRKRGMSKFSIDLMTSFEVAIRPQHKPNFVNCEPKIQEITESDNVLSEKGSQIDKNEMNTYQSLHLREPVAVQETCPSPEPSININMNDYDSSDEEVSASEISATFYNNLMGQVNNILKKAQIQTRDDLVFKKEKRKTANAEQNITLNKVKEATLKRLKNIGVTLGPMDDTDSSSSIQHDTGNYNPTEISFAVKQLLMKYLPDDQLAKIANKQEQPTPMNDKETGIMTARPEFSLASVQYMKKYNLISSEGYKGELPFKGHTPWQNLPRPQMDNDKILDMTALKMQPKLL